MLTEGEIAVPRLGTVRAGPQFRLIAAMNPFDAIGTARVSHAIADRICRVVLGYQDAAAERAITTAVTGRDGRRSSLPSALTRATRVHRDVRMGSSVRGSIDLVLLLTGLQRLRGEPGLAIRPPGTPRTRPCPAGSGSPTAASGPRSPCWTRSWTNCGLPTTATPDGADGADGAGERPPEPDPASRGKADGQPGASADRLAAPGQSRSSLRRDRGGGGAARRSIGRAELALRHPSFEEISPGVGELDEDALAGLLASDPDARRGAARRPRRGHRPGAAGGRAAAGGAGVHPAGPAAAPRTRGTRRLEPSRSGEGDLDLERTMARWPGSGPPHSEDLVTRAWAARTRAVCLLVDASGSMAGPGVAMAAVAAAAVVLASGHRLAPSVIAFSSEVRVLQPQGTRRPPDDLVGDLVGLRGHGVTDLARALRAAAAQLARADGDERVAVLLSDCLRTAGADPATALAGIDRLHVLCPAAEDRPPGRDGPGRGPGGGPGLAPGLATRPGTAAAAGPAAALARAGGGISQPVRTLADVAPALHRILA